MPASGRVVRCRSQRVPNRSAPRRTPPRSTNRCRARPRRLAELGTEAEPVGSTDGRGRAYPPIRDLAAIGDGRTVALVTKDGSVCWLPLPSLDAPTVFGALLDAKQGGAFELAPSEPYRVDRRYLPDTNVLETTFTTDRGVAKVIDAMTLPLGQGLIPTRELARRIEGATGQVGFEWIGEGALRLRHGRHRRLDAPRNAGRLVGERRAGDLLVGRRRAARRERLS